MYVFLFLQFDLFAHIYSFSFTNLQNYKKNNMKIFTLQFCCTKKPIRYALNATNKNLLFSFFLGFPPCYFSSAFGSHTHFSLKPRRNSLLDKPRTLWGGPPPLTIYKPCGALNKVVHTHFSPHSETPSLYIYVFSLCTKYNVQCSTL